MNVAGTILYVEDQEYLRKYFTSYLERQGFDVITAKDGGKALALLKENRGSIALVITDLHMPGVSGNVVARNAFEHDIPVIVLSGTIYDLAEDVRKQCLYTLTKPDGFAFLINTLHPNTGTASYPAVDTPTSPSPTHSFKQAI